MVLLLECRKKKKKEYLQEQTVFVEKNLCVSYLKEDFKFKCQNNQLSKQLFRLTQVKLTIMKLLN